MMNLQESLIRASTLARLESVKTRLEAEGTASTWDASERAWFCSFLSPFSAEPHLAFILTAGGNASELDASGIVDELLAEVNPGSADALETLKREIEGLARLYSHIASEPTTLDYEDVARALRLVKSARQRLLAEVPNRSSFGEMSSRRAWF